MDNNSLEIIYQKRGDKLIKVMEFISKNRHIKDNVDLLINSKTLINGIPAKEKIRIVFIDCLNAAGGSNLTRNGKAGKYFYSKIKTLPEDPKIDLQDLFNCFDDNIKSLQDFYNFLSNSKDLINFGKKKAALFIYKLHWLQNNLNSKQRFFSQYKVSNEDMVIPIDAVITLLLNKILKIPAQYTLDQNKDFELINDFFKTKLKERFILMEDLWFWGYFTTKGSGSNRTLEFNEDKFYTTDLLIPLSLNQKYFEKFIDLINN